MNRTAAKVLAGALGGSAGGLVVSAMVQSLVALGVDPASDMVQMQRRGLRKAGMAVRAPEDDTTVSEEAVAHGWHMALSAGLGALFGLFRPPAGRRQVATGALWGLAFYPLAFWLLGPLTGLTEWPWRERKDLLLRRPLVHLAFGATTGVLAALAERLLPVQDQAAPIRGR